MSFYWINIEIFSLKLYGCSSCQSFVICKMNDVLSFQVILIGLNKYSNRIWFPRLATFFFRLAISETIATRSLYLAYGFIAKNNIVESKLTLLTLHKMCIMQHTYILYAKCIQWPADNKINISINWQHIFWVKVLMMYRAICVLWQNIEKSFK